MTGRLSRSKEKARTHLASARAAPRCQKGCLDPQNPSLRALKAGCACSRSGGAARDYASEAAPVASSDTADAALTEMHPSSATSAVSLDVVLAAAEAAINTANEIDLREVSRAQDPPHASPPPLPAFMSGLQAQAILNEINPTSAFSAAARVNSPGSDSEEDSDLPAGQITRPPDTRMHSAFDSIMDAISEEATQQEDEDDNAVEDQISSQQAGSMLDSGNAHNYLRENIKYERDTEERNRLMRRNLWRITKSVAEFGARTGTAVFFAWANLEPGKHKVQDMVYADPILCDPSRPTLRNMAQSMFHTFTRETELYRESKRATTIEHLQERQVWQAKELEFLARIQQLESQLHRTPRSTSGPDPNLS
ncbi:hypothetical protein OC846_006623 [Tilletia horrida]|uniref:Uncharacterized protein n=1 Tax=Tilletia horrida TaxID=155126 RepID=A0AAN6GIH9_9BASI|nr:hypothetical protein OC846_006623 [Tilletia horrida]KAK0559211.1 hypothetical protein OC861_006715 [Tilletia horrida]